MAHLLMVVDPPLPYPPLPAVCPLSAHTSKIQEKIKREYEDKEWILHRPKETIETNLKERDLGNPYILF